MPRPDGLGRNNIMIDRALEHLASHLNNHLRRNFRVAEDVVVVSSLQDAGGTPAVAAANKIVLFLSSIEHDTLAHRAPGSHGAPGIGRLVEVAPVYLNLLVMCAANFGGSQYPQALKYLASAIAFFQANAVFDHQNTPDMDPRLERLVLNIENLSSQDMHSLWNIHGGRYLPSTLFRLRLITLDGDLLAREPVVGRPEVTVAA